MTIGQRIKNRRIELGLTQTDLADRMGNITKSAISNVENGKEDLTTSRVIKYAKALGTTPSYLMGWDEDEESQFNMDNAQLVAKIRDDKPLTIALHKLLQLTASQRNHVYETIDLFYSSSK